MTNNNYIFYESNHLRLDTLNKVLNPFSQQLIKKLPLKSHMAILEVGCGNGTMACWLAEAIATQGFVTAVDVNADLIHQAQKLAHEKRLTNIMFKVMSVYDLTNFQKQFDMVYHRLLVDHLTNPQAALKAMISRLKHSGLLVSETAIHSHCYSDPNCASYESLIKLLKQMLLAQGKDYDIGKSWFQITQKLNLRHLDTYLIQPLLIHPKEKTLMIFGLTGAKDALINEGLLTQQEFSELLHQLEIDKTSLGYWTMPTICQSVCSS